MAQPGWYPDPDRTPGRYRFWTGTAWTDRTTFEPPQASGGGSSRNSRRPRRRALAVLAAVFAVAVVIVLAVAMVNRHRSAVREEPSTVPTSSVSGWNDSSPLPAASATASPTAGLPGTPDPVGSTRPQACDQYQGSSSPDPSHDGRVHGGALSFSKLPSGWRGPQPTTRLPFSKDAAYQYQQLPEKLGWEASAYVGRSTISSDVDGLQATRQMLQCVVTSDFYVSVDVRLTENSARKITVDGVSGVQRDALLRFKHPQ